MILPLILAFLRLLGITFTSPEPPAPVVELAGPDGDDLLPPSPDVITSAPDELTAADFLDCWYDLSWLDEVVEYWKADL